MKFQAIAYPLVLLIDVIMFVSMYQWNKQSLEEFQQKQLDIQVNYATTAGVDLMLNETAHINTDYATWGEMDCDPYQGWNGFMACLIRSFGWADTPENREALEADYMRFMCVAVYDGYYMKQRSRELDSELVVGGSPVDIQTYPLIWTPKIPYAEVANNGSSYYFRSYNLNYDSYYRDTVMKNTGNLIDHTRVVENKGGNYVTENHQRAVVTGALTEAINAAIFADMNGANSIEYYIPFEYSEFTHTNGIEGPSIITYITREGGTYKNGVSTFAVGGSKIDDANWYICFNEGGKKLYVHADNRELAELTYGHPLQIDQIVPSMKQAALDGYYPDTKFLTK